ncbi:MAG: phage head closure protein [Planctomycetaceae bacterium]|nr:phage head closure protein [Planctomycetaceae bacterium]
MTVHAGKLSRRVLIEKPTKTHDATGQIITAWETHGTFWAGVTTGAAGEDLRDNRQVSEDVRWQIVLRYNSQTSQIASDWRVRLGDQVLSIQSAVDVDDAHTRILLTALERKP